MQAGGVVEAAPGQPYVERGSAAGAGQHLFAQRGPGQRAAAGGAAVAVGVERAAHRAHQHTRALDPHNHRPAGRRAEIGQRRPLALLAAPARRRRQPDLQQRRRLCHPGHLDGGDLGRGVQHGARLEIDEPPGSGRCRDCAAVFDVDDPIVLCPACDSASVHVLSGRALRVLSVEVITACAPPADAQAP
ncbi:hydrogenase maturation nickel metallochaperone HypA [Nonomuraea endophytica]|uniref:hydrogenase maturation nickel metallochaperone HypA n=1 Tax=Nonomuraea endophytica TaxID=714136 RepID=UPI0037C66AFE